MIGDLFFWAAVACLVVASLAAMGARSLREFSLAELEELTRKWNSPLRQTEILRHYDVMAVAVECLSMAAPPAW